MAEWKGPRTDVGLFDLVTLFAVFCVLAIIASLADGF